MIERELERILRARRSGIGRMSARSVARVLGRASSSWMSARDPYRLRAIDRLVRASGYSKAMARELLDALFGSLEEKALLRALEGALRDPAALDRYVPDPASPGRSVRARGPELVTHVLASNVGSPAVVSLVRALLVKSASAIKISRRDAGFVDLYLQSLSRHDRRLSDACLLLDPSDRQSLSKAAARSGLVVAYGSDASVGKVRRLVPPTTPFLSHGHRVSVCVVWDARSALRGSAAERLARDVWMADQRGCLSPAVCLVRRSGRSSEDERFAGELARALSERVRQRGAGRADAARARGHARLVRRWKTRALVSRARVWSSEPPGTWQVLYEEKPGGPPAGAGGLSILVRGFSGLRDLLDQLEPYRGHAQAAAVEAPEPEAGRLAEALSEMGFSRLAEAGRLAYPPFDWHQDGLPGLSGWLRWTDREKGAAGRFVVQSRR